MAKITSNSSEDLSVFGLLQKYRQKKKKTFAAARSSTKLSQCGRFSKSLGTSDLDSKCSSNDRLTMLNFQAKN